MTGWIRRDKKGGWIRLWRNGPGISWARREEPILYSDRKRRTVFARIWKWRVKRLKRGQDVKR